MQRLIDQIERCSSKAAVADPHDLRALAELHTDLLAIPLIALQPNSETAKMRPAFLQSVEQAAAIVEKLVLSEGDDASVTIEMISRQIDELRGLIDGSSSRQSNSGVSAVSIAPAAPLIHANVEEQVITEGDAPLALEFVGEATGHLETAETSLLKVEEDPTDPTEVNTVFRAFHTIKGVAGFLGLKQIGALAHAAETLLDLARKGKLQLTGTVLDVVLEARDVMGRMVRNVEIAARSFAAPAVQEGLDSLLSRLDAATRGEKPTASAEAPISKPSGNAPVAKTCIRRIRFPSPKRESSPKRSRQRRSSKGGYRSA